MEALKIPKFRRVGRVASWMEKNSYWERIPQVEQLFHSSNEPDHIILDALTDYSENIDEFPDDLETLLYEKAKKVIPDKDFSDHQDTIQGFLNFCYIRNKDGEDVSKYIDLFAGRSELLYRWAMWSNCRLPTHLEDTMDDPDVLLNYAVNIIKGRVPEHLENFLQKDISSAIEYAFKVIRGFSSVRLPDSLHNAIVLESFKDPENEEIKDYMRATENDSSKTDNIVYHELPL